MLKKDRTYHYDIDGVDTVVTDTLIMAKEFGLQHRNLLIKVRKVMDRQIERQADTSARLTDNNNDSRADTSARLNTSSRLTDNNNDRRAEVSALLSVESSYISDQNKKQPKIILTEKAFHYVIAKISYAKGKDAQLKLDNIKYDFIDEFFVMRKHIDKLLKALRLLVEKFAPHDDNGHISIFNMKKRLNAVKGYVTSNKTGTPLTDEDMELLREVYQMEEFVDIKKESVLKHERNKKSRSKKSVPCKTALEMRETGVISKKEAEQNGVYQQGIFRF